MFWPYTQSYNVLFKLLDNDIYWEFVGVEILSKLPGFSDSRKS